MLVRRTVWPCVRLVHSQIPWLMRSTRSRSDRRRHVVGRRHYERRATNTTETSLHLNQEQQKSLKRHACNALGETHTCRYPRTATVMRAKNVGQVAAQQQTCALIDVRSDKFGGEWCAAWE